MYETESANQQQLFLWAQWLEPRYPELTLMYHIPNEGKRSKAAGGRLKAEGMKTGVPDICLPVARGEYHGLYIELKVGKNKPSEMQEWWISALRNQGYAAEVCYGWVEAKEATTQSQRRQTMHVCPLQIDIVDRIINRYSNPGEVVFDPFGGLMTVPVRALHLGRKGYGVELNPDYFRDGVGYLDSEEAQRDMPTLFDFVG